MLKADRDKAEQIDIKYNNKEPITREDILHLLNYITDLEDILDGREYVETGGN
jgi:hypothetical protein